MKYLVFIFLLFFVLGSQKLLGQCSDVPVADSSFEAGTLTDGGAFMPGKWYRDDGCSISPGDPYVGDSCALSNGGGAFQVIPVVPNTTYHMSFYVRNGTNDPLLHFRINWMSYHFSPSSNNWTFATQSFNSGPDTTAIIGFYSGGACFDQVRVTCSPIIGRPEPLGSQGIISLYPSISSTGFKVKSDQPCALRVLNVSGKVVVSLKSREGTRTFGEALPTGVYFVEVLSGKKKWMQKIVKF